MSWLPNLLTLARFPLAFWIAVSIHGGAFREALLLVAAAGLTDGLDGWLARRMNTVSRLGTLLDPLADKALLVTVYVSLGASGLVGMWLVWLVVGRDVLILLFAAVAMAFGKTGRLVPSVWGKLSTAVQVVTGVAVIAARAAPSSATLVWMGSVLPVVTAITTGWSGLHYAWLGARMFGKGASGSALPGQDAAGGGGYVARG